MRQNSFQKNGLLNVNDVNQNNSVGQKINQFGRRTVEEVKIDMLNAKQKKYSFDSAKLDENKNYNNNNQNNMKNRIDYLKKMDNINRWK